jgi:hypothetical protein
VYRERREREERKREERKRERERTSYILIQIKAARR